MIRPGHSWLLALREQIRIFLYREIRDVYRGLFTHPRWLLMRKIARFDSVKSLVKYRRSRAAQRQGAHDVSQRPSPIFTDVDIDRMVDSLRKDGICLGIHLPRDIREQIFQYTKNTLCYGHGKPYWGFYYHEKNTISHKHNLNLTAADYFNTANCQVIQRIIDDPILLEIARKYLGGIPVHQGTRLRWTFRTNLSALEKFKYNRTFHYDLDDYAAIKFFFYLTDVDMEDGPHVCIMRSHTSKNVLHRLLRGMHNDEQITDYYGVENVNVLCGTAGFGFVEDTFIMHKGLTPTNNDRLILIIEYALRDYGMKHDCIQEAQLQELD